MARHGGGLSVIVAAGVPGAARVGLAVGKDVGSAVRRNRVKRQLREALASVPLRDGHDYVVVARAEFADLAFDAMVDALREAVAGG